MSRDANGAPRFSFSHVVMPQHQKQAPVHPLSSVGRPVVGGHAATSRNPRMAVVCCVCHARAGEAACAPEQVGEVTHTYCASCLARLMHEFQTSAGPRPGRPSVA